MCNCRKDIEQRLLNSAKSDHPGSTDHTMKLTGYALVCGDDGWSSKQIMPIEGSYTIKTKAGKPVTKKIKASMCANFCMFCGEKYEKDSA